MNTTVKAEERVRTVYLIATEESGDRLGSALMRELRSRLGATVRFAGIGGQSMAGEGLVSLFPIEELSIIGFAAVLQRLPMILKLIRRAADDVLAAKPDILVIIDSPDFTHRVARRVRRRDPAIPIVDYVSPTVWAWRPGRARAMLGYVDHVLALLPFEPAEYRRLQGPRCSYVGHPLTEQFGSLRPNDEAEQARRAASPPVLLVLPGSRRSEVRHHAAAFGETLAQLRRDGVAFEAVLPTTPHLEALVRAAVASWEVQPRIVVGEQDKRAAFRIAHAALAKSGTVTLELAIAGVPMVTAYRAGSLEVWIARRVVRPGTVILANLVIGEEVVPEFIQEDCVTAKLAPAVRDLLGDTPARRRQLAGFAKIDGILSTGAQTPSARAADIVLDVMRHKGGDHHSASPAD
ncbi:lipid-A-disaccharide synthase [Rhodopseudomonas palustris]|uniref:Lipid-A-disaccharide synthase n=1 Tax=Rhodopseudomonas palustris TaxID=1076 RepID=A0A323UM20_RHOPL|nr:lipid-A-disaccharide synthase [Rhodopseudomonas palustris]PZA12076.1 lipid-A-disaccharide synthase [Rhodopseudomonas palustris]